MNERTRYPPLSMLAIIAAISVCDFSSTTCLAFLHPNNRPPSPIASKPPLLSFSFHSNSRSLSHRKTCLKLSSPSSSNKSAPPPLPTTDDPFLLLGLDSRNPPTNPKEIKRAYRKRAMQYHPDVLLGPNSTEEERQRASNDFARINAAYEMLTGGGKGADTSGAGSGSSTSSTSSGYGGYTPPHRRSGTSSYSNYGATSNSKSSTYNKKSTNWEDYMPNSEEDAKYDTGGDSFGAIFSDLLTGAAGAAAGMAGSVASGRGGIMGDLIDFLERNVDDFQSGYDDDRSLSELLQFGTFEDVASEMDETDVLVTSLERKLSMVADEMMQVQADLTVNPSLKFSEKLDLEERMAELKAREKVVKGYLKKGRSRLVKLRERYKELIVEGRGGRGYGRTTDGSSSGTGSYSSSTSGNRSSNSYSRGTGRTASSTTSSSTQSSYSDCAYSAPSTSPTPSSTSSRGQSDTSKSWRNEGFTSTYGGRSSSSRRRSQRGTAANTTNEQSSSTNRDNMQNQGNQNNRQSQQRENIYSGSTRTSPNTTTANGTGASRSSVGSSSTSSRNEPWAPPHRRMKSAAEQASEEKRRLRELQVDDEFEKLKREMGL